jgi:hypothetical protein
MIKVPFYTLVEFPRLQSALAPCVVDLMKLHPRDRLAESKKILGKFDISVDDNIEWCFWEKDKDYTMFILRWS